MRSASPTSPGSLREHAEVLRELRRGRVGRPESVVHQLAIVEPEDRRAECGDDLELVGGVVDGPQHPQQLVDLTRAVDQRATFDAVGHAGLAQRVLEHTEARAAADEDRDVAIARGSVRATGRIADHPWPRPGDRLLHDRGDVGGLGASRVVGRVVVDLRAAGHAQARRRRGRSSLMFAGRCGSRATYGTCATASMPRRWPQSG